MAKSAFRAARAEKLNASSRARSERSFRGGPKREGDTSETYYRSVEQVASIAPLVRVKPYQVHEQGRGRFIDYKRIFDILRAKHYNGYCCNPTAVPGARPGLRVTLAPS